MTLWWHSAFQIEIISWHQGWEIISWHLLQYRGGHGPHTRHPSWWEHLACGQRPSLDHGKLQKECFKKVLPFLEVFLQWMCLDSSSARQVAHATGRLSCGWQRPIVQRSESRASEWLEGALLEWSVSDRSRIAASFVVWSQPKWCSPHFGFCYFMD